VDGSKSMIENIGNIILALVLARMNPQALGAAMQGAGLTPGELANVGAGMTPMQTALPPPRQPVRAMQVPQGAFAGAMPVPRMMVTPPPVMAPAAPMPMTPSAPQGAPPPPVIASGPLPPAAGLTLPPIPEVPGNVTMAGVGDRPANTAVPAVPAAPVPDPEAETRLREHLDEMLRICIEDLTDERREQSWVDYGLELLPKGFLDLLAQSANETVAVEIIHMRASPERFAALYNLVTSNQAKYQLFVNGLNELIAEHKKGKTPA